MGGCQLVEASLVELSYIYIHLGRRRIFGGTTRKRLRVYIIIYLAPFGGVFGMALHGIWGNICIAFLAKSKKQKGGAP